MKIAFVIDDTVDKPDGVQQYVLTLGEWFRSRGHDVHYLAGESSRQDIPNVHSLSRNIAVRFNGNRLTVPRPANARKIRALLEAEKFDVLHVQMPYSPMMAHKVIMQAPAGTAIVGTFHIMPESQLVARGTKLLGRWLRKSLDRFDQVYAVSPVAREFAKTAFGLPKVTTLPNVVSMADYASVRPPQDPAAVPTVMFLGRLVPRKGCATFLDAVGELRYLYEKPFKAVVCGKGPLLDDLKRQASRLGIADIVEFAGFVPEADKPQRLADASVVAFPSSGGESFGIVLLEAMAAGQNGGGPVVLGANNPGYASVLIPRPELLFRPGDHKELATKMAHYLQDGLDRADTLAWQQMHIRQFDVAAVGQRLLAGYAAHLRKTA